MIFIRLKTLQIGGEAAEGMVVENPLAYQKQPRQRFCQNIQATLGSGG